MTPAGLLPRAAAPDGTSARPSVWRVGVAHPKTLPLPVGDEEQQPGHDGLRQGLDEVDSGIVRLIAERRGLIEAIAKVKEQGTSAIQDPDRERRVLDGVVAVATDLGVSASLVRTIFRELISDSVAQQARHLNGDGGGRVRVAFQGAAHAYSDAAAQKYLAGRGLEGDLTGYRTFREAADALLAGEADLAVLPIENTTAGSINEVYALLRSDELFIVGEETWKVDHCLAAAADVPLSALSRILSHPQGLEQCAQFLQSLPNAAPTTYFDTAGAMQAVAAAGDPTVAAIASPEAAAAYGLVVLRHDISDFPDNFTRFVVLSPTAATVDLRIPCKTSLILVTRHEEGALLRCLEVLSGSGHSMTKLESRPRPGPAVGVPVLPRLRGQRRRPADLRRPRRAAVGGALHQGSRQLPGQGAAARGTSRGPARPAGRRVARPRRWRRSRRSRCPPPAGPGSTSSSTGPPGRPIRSSASATCSSAATASW